MMRKTPAVIVLAIVVAGMAAGPAYASAADVANKIAAEVASPFCPGVTLENCPSDKAVELRARIESWAEQGWGEDRILAELVDLYGESIRAVPRFSGAGLWAWLAPGIGILAGLCLAVALTRRWTRESRTGSGAPRSVGDAARARVNDELDALRGRP